MDASSVSVLLYRKSKPLGKVRRRVQDLRIPSPYYSDFLSALDLSHNESTRLAVDCLLNRGLEGYREVLNTEGEVDFLSELEKNYILENGRDGNTDDPGASDDDDKNFKSLSAGSWSSTRCPTKSTDSDSTVADVRWNDMVLDQPSVEIYFQCDSRAVGIKDLVRKFIRKANMAVAIVMDSFSDVELLCDLLEASRKRNVSVYLLLDHFNLNLFVSLWQDLKLNSKNFPKLLVRSVDGQTYCAKTGRKLTGQIAESFIITDWTEVLTGSYSFTWLSWQVHRSLAVVVKGSAVTPFHQEFQRLYFSSKPVPGFVTFITVPHTLPLYTLHATQKNNSGIFKSKLSQTKTTCHWAWAEDALNTQTKGKMPVVSSPQSPELEHKKGDNKHRAGIDTPKHTEPPQLYPKPMALPHTQQNVSMEKHTAGGVFTLHDAQTHVESLNPNQVQNHSNPFGQTRISNVQSHLAGLTISTTAEKNPGVQKSNPLHTEKPTHTPHRTVQYQSTYKNLNLDQVGSEGLFFQRRNENRTAKPSGTGAGLNTPRGQWNYSITLKTKLEPSDNPKLLSLSTLQQTQANTGLQSLCSNSQGYSSGLEHKVSSLGTNRHPPLQSHPTTDAQGLKSAAMGTHLKPQLQTESKLFSPGARAKLHLQPHTSQQVKPSPKLKWMPQSHAARPRPLARTSSFDTTYGMGQKMGGPLGWRPFNSNMTLLGRSKSLTERRTTGLNPNITTI